MSTTRALIVGGLAVLTLGVSLSFRLIYDSRTPATFDNISMPRETLNDPRPTGNIDGNATLHFVSGDPGIGFEYPQSYSLRTGLASHTIVIDSRDRQGALPRQEFVFSEQANPRRLSLSNFRQQMTPMIYSNGELLSSPIGSLYRYTGDVNPYVYIFADATTDSVWVFQMNFEPHTLDDLKVFYQILASVKFVNSPQ